MYLRCLYLQSKMKQLSKFVFLAVLIVYGFAQNCKQPLPNDLLQSGIVHLQHTQFNSEQFKKTYDIPLNFLVTNAGFQMTLAISQFEKSNSFQNQFNFIAFRGESGSPHVARIQLIIPPNKSWTKVSVSYLFSAREDMTIGNYFENIVYQNTNGVHEISLKHGVVAWKPVLSPVMTFVKLSGLRVSSTTPFSYNQVIEKSSFNTQSALLSVAVSIDASTRLSLIQISYILWAVGFAPTLQFQPFSPSQISQISYKFIGIEKITGSKIQYQGIGFNRAGYINCIGSKCTADCITQEKCIQQSGKIQNNKCFICKETQIIQNERCVSSIIEGVLAPSIWSDVMAKQSQGGRVLNYYSRFTMSYIPQQFKANDCATCSNLIIVTITNGVVLPIKTDYEKMHQSKYQFRITFDLMQYVGPAPTVQFEIKINPAYSSYFQQKDLDQRIIKKLVPW